MSRVAVCLLLLIGLTGASGLTGWAPSPAASAAPGAGTPQDWLAWTMAPDGALFAVDSRAVLYQLSPVDLAPQSYSQPLLAVEAPAPVYLAADATYLFLGSGAISQTLVLRRSDFGEVARLDNFGPIALDPGRQLFMIPQVVPFDPFNSAVWAYRLDQLDRSPQSILLECQSPQELVVNAKARQLYVRVHGICSSPPHQREAYAVYALNTLEPAGESEPQLGRLSRAAVAADAGRLVVTLDAYNTGQSLFILDRQGHQLDTRSRLNGKPATDARGTWIYLLRRQGLWVLSGQNLALRSLVPFTQSPPADLALSPDGATLYLLGNGWHSALSTRDLQRIGIGAVSSIPASWFGTDWIDYAQPRLYPSPQLERDGRLFVQIMDGVNFARETYRSSDGGRSWDLLTSLTYPGYPAVVGLSLSPDFAADRTLAALELPQPLRSGDAGDSWQAFDPPLAFVSERDGNREIYVLGDGERPRRLTTNPAADENPAWSPAWTRLAFQSQRTGNWDIFTMRADCMAPADSSCDLRQLTANHRDNTLPAWSPDGRQIAFVSTRDGNPELYVMDSDGQNQRRLTFYPSGDWRPAWLRDSQHLVFTSYRTGSNDIYQLRVPAPGEPPPTTELDLTPIVTGPADDRDPAVTELGELLFLSDRDGVMKTYIQYPNEQPFAYTRTDQPEAHPTLRRSGVGMWIVVETSRDSKAGIYQANYGSDAAGYSPVVISEKGFDGHPAWMASWWTPDETASLDWLEAHQN